MNTLHGVEIPDPYRWLEDQNSAETRAWIDAQDACTASVLEQAAGARKISAKRLSELMKVDSIIRRWSATELYFFAKRRADQDLFRALLAPRPRRERTKCWSIHMR